MAEYGYGREIGNKIADFGKEYNGYVEKKAVVEKSQLSEKKKMGESRKKKMDKENMDTPKRKS